MSPSIHITATQIVYQRGPLSARLNALSTTFLLDQVQMYAEETGQTLSQCIDEALTEWLECRAYPTLEALREKPKLRVIK